MYLIPAAGADLSEWLSDFILAESEISRMLETPSSFFLPPTQIILFKSEDESETKKKRNPPSNKKLGKKVACQMLAG